MIAVKHLLEVGHNLYDFTKTKEKQSALKRNKKNNCAGLEAPVYKMIFRRENWVNKMLVDTLKRY